MSHPTPDGSQSIPGWNTEYAKPTSEILETVVPYLPTDFQTECRIELLVDGGKLYAISNKVRLNDSVYELLGEQYVLEVS